MALLLKDALQLPLLRAARVLTDPDVANHRLITSVSVIEAPVGKFIRRGEFVMSTGMNVGRNAKILRSFVSEIAEAGAATLAIAIGPHTPRVPKQVIEAANQLKLPLVEMPWELRFSEVSEAILRGLIHETSKIRSRDEFVWCVASRNISEDAAIAQGWALGFDFSQPSIAVVGRLSKIEEQAHPAVQAEARFVEGLCSKTAAQNQVQWVSTVVGNSIVGYLQIPRLTQRINSILASVQSAVSDKCGLSWGVGRVCRAFADFAPSYEDARVACELGMLTRGKGRITHVSDVVTDRVLLNLQGDTLASILLERYVEPLNRFHRMPLLGTLETFFESDCNVSETARKLSISRQSMLYRLKKIENVLTVDLREPDIRFGIVFALRLHKLQRLGSCGSQISKPSPNLIAPSVSS